jgi:FAD/FMN-containing dehydrogenase
MARWTNWAGNQASSPERIVVPRDEGEVGQAVRRAADEGMRVRALATGHSFSPVCVTDGVLLDMRELTGVRRASDGTATVGPGTTVGQLGEPLWDVGYALANQGDIDTQQIAGAVSTGTHGSGIGLASFSAGVRSARIVTATGEVIVADASTPELLAAVQCSVGMVGVLTELEIDVAPAYRLRERIEQVPYADVMERWDELVAGHRHFSFFWLPTEGSAALYGIETPAGRQVADTCYVKIYDDADPDEPDSAELGRRVDRPYRIYPAVFEPNFYELEYFVPIDRGPAAVAAMREFMLANQPAAVFPLEVRTVAPDTAWLSSQYGQATTVLSVSGVPGTDYEPYLRAVDRLLADFDARVHWGKLHYLTREQLHARYPRAADFIALRRTHDPHGLFLNPHLDALFA